MKSLIRCPEYQNKRESASLSYALWCAAFFAGIDPFDGSDRSGLLELLIAADQKRVVAATVVELMEMARSLKFTVELRLVGRHNADSEAILEPREPLAKHLMELYKYSGVCSDSAVCDQLCDPDVTFDALFELAVKAGYNLYIRLGNGLETIPSNKFSTAHPDLYELYQYRLRVWLKAVKAA
jgi:hypothetical protein